MSVNACVCASLEALTLSNIYILETSGSIAIAFYLKHHLGVGKSALGFGLERIRTLVSMITDISHKAIIGKTVYPHFLRCFDRIPLNTCR